MKITKTIPTIQDKNSVSLKNWPRIFTAIKIPKIPPIKEDGIILIAENTDDNFNAVIQGIPHVK